MIFPFPYPNDEDEFDGSMNISSGTECTGLIPSAAVSDEEYDSYNELYNFLPNAVHTPENE